ncbi:hexitol phosphatase HxpB [uncultured Shewanella sp.]|uniref:hexitol phosphatase HxpB n=1 Tax=Shewanella atlantica TaxID=271099 RepID=UPI00260A0982|nr:hexitol phosphatase HxpB [uncultured Shewanella sp.]
MTASRLSAIIFDMDGILIDSEPTWQKAEYQTMRDLGLEISFEDTLQTTGLRIDQVVSYWYQRFPWDNYDNNLIAGQIVEQVASYILKEGAPMPGVIDALNYCRERELKIGLATSSSHAIVDAVLQKLDIKHYFDSVQSAEHLAYGKPHPEVYLNCAKELVVCPTECIAVEDSFNGLVAARAANMQALAIPAQEQRLDTKWVIAHQQLDDLTELPEYLEGKIKF